MGIVVAVLWGVLFILYIVCLIVEHSLSDDEHFKMYKYDIVPNRLLTLYTIWCGLFLITGVLSIIYMVKGC